MAPCRTGVLLKFQPPRSVMVVAVLACKTGQSLAANFLAINDIQWLLHFDGPTLARVKKWSHAFQKDTREREQRRQPARTLSRRHLDIVPLRNAYLSPLSAPISRTFLDFLSSEPSLNYVRVILSISYPLISAPPV